MKYYFYVLRSKHDGRYYKGQTEDIEARLRRHNRGDSKSTKAGRPWELVYVEEYSSRAEAIHRERLLKSASGWKEWESLRSKIEKKCNFNSEC
ncbi:MAG: GIY-YIG nuclease family protein [Ignavibacteriales bacterium]|nr:GIY-YIG nuclease family protein [Bacteroidota bacterium]MBI3578921.1 GIY-YIG nuclease family protein [Ignavibacteriales bacterium]